MTTCERDDFCILPNGHEGECDQPFHDGEPTQPPLPLGAIRTASS